MLNMLRSDIYRLWKSGALVAFPIAAAIVFALFGTAEIMDGAWSGRAGSGDLYDPTFVGLASAVGFGMFSCFRSYRADGWFGCLIPTLKPARSNGLRHVASPCALYRCRSHHMLRRRCCCHCHLAGGMCLVARGRYYRGGTGGCRPGCAMGSSRSAGVRVLRKHRVGHLSALRRFARSVVRRDSPVLRRIG